MMRGKKPLLVAGAITGAITATLIGVSIVSKITTQKRFSNPYSNYARSRSRITSQKRLEKLQASM